MNRHYLLLASVLWLSLHWTSVLAQEPKDKADDQMFSDGNCLFDSSEDDTDVTFFPHPTDCTKYYMCNHRIPILMTCPPKLYFNPKHNVCDYVRNVECEEYQRQKN